MKLHLLQFAVGAVSRKQIKVALSDAGLLEQFEAVVSNPIDSEGKLAWISWQEDDSFSAQSSVMILVLPQLKLDEKQITELFAAAAKV